MVTGGMEFSSLYRRGRLQRRKDFQKIVRRISKDHFRLFGMKLFSLLDTNPKIRGLKQACRTAGVITQIKMN